MFCIFSIEDLELCSILSGSATLPRVCSHSDQHRQEGVTWDKSVGRPAGLQHVAIGGHMGGGVQEWSLRHAPSIPTLPAGWFCDSARNNLSHSKAASPDCQPRTAAAPGDQVRAIFSGRKSNPQTVAQPISPLIVAASPAGAQAKTWCLAWYRGLEDYFLP